MFIDLRKMYISYIFHRIFTVSTHMWGIDPYTVVLCVILLALTSLLPFHRMTTTWTWWKVIEGSIYLQTELCIAVQTLSSLKIRAPLSEPRSKNRGISLKLMINRLAYFLLVKKQPWESNAGYRKIQLWMIRLLTWYQECVITLYI